MEPIAWHITFDLRGRLPIARTAAEWERAVRILWRVLSPWANLGFCIMHDHLHVLVAVDRATAGRVAQAVECAVGWWRRPRGTERRSTWNPPRFTAMRDRRHLGTSAAYVLRNGAEATGTSALDWRWSSAWEVLGLRRQRFPLAKGFEVTSPAFVADALIRDPSWRPPLAPATATATEAPSTIIRISAAALGFVGRADMARADRGRHVDLAVALGRRRGWAAQDLAPGLLVHARTATRAAAPPAEDFDAAVRLLGLHLSGRPLADLPPDPVPVASRRMPFERGRVPQP